MKIKNTEFHIIKADLTKLKADAVVIDVPVNFKQGLHRLGEAVAFKERSLKSKFSIFAALLTKTSDSDEASIRLACRNIFLLANKLKLKSIALPPLGYNEGRFPLVGAAKIMTQEVLRYLREHKTTLSKIIFCLADTKSFHLVNKTVRGYVEHILYKFSEGPFVTVDAIIEVKNGIILIERSNPPYGLALPGGFVDYGESLEEAVKREAKEETNMELLNLKQFHTYSKPDRDPRFHTIGTVFVAKGKGKPQFGDDAQGLRVIKFSDLLKLNYTFDHKSVIKDYLESRRKK